MHISEVMNHLLLFQFSLFYFHVLKKPGLLLKRSAIASSAILLPLFYFEQIVSLEHNRVYNISLQIQPPIPVWSTMESSSASSSSHFCEFSFLSSREHSLLFPVKLLDKVFRLFSIHCRHMSILSLSLTKRKPLKQWDESAVQLQVHNLRETRSFSSEKHLRLAYCIFSTISTPFTTHIITYHL